MSPTHATPRTRSRTLAATLLAALALLGSFLLPLAMVQVLTFTNFPAFGNSHFTRALTTFTQILFTILACGAAIWAYWGRLRTQRGDTPSYWFTHFGPGLLSSLAVSGFVTATLAIPLAATKLYLGGIGGDQAFRTQYLTRLTSSPALHDMAYTGMPPYYPSAWFWLGGRFANLMGLSGWEAYKPWAILSLALACGLATAIWCSIIRPDLGILLGMVTALVTTAYGSPEPYAAIVSLALPLIFLLGWSAINPRRGVAASRRYATAAVAFMLGISACTYTLFTALGAVTLILMALLVTAHRLWVHRHDLRRQLSRHLWQPSMRLAIIGFSSLAIALIHWGYYFFRGRGLPRSESGSALHYLPGDAATLLLPMFKADAVGLLCFIGLVWLIAAFRTSRIAQAFSLGIISMYLWMLASMGSVLFGTTLLGFRVVLPLTLTFALAGVCGVVSATRRAVSLAVRHVAQDPTPPPTATPAPASEPNTYISYSGSEQPIYVRRTARTIQAIVAVIALFVGVGFAQDIPGTLSTDIQTAYTDTDGNGSRADRFPAGIASYYPQVNQALLEGAATRQGRPAKASDIIVLTTEEALLAYYPYWSFQAISPHYANPLGLYQKRNQLIEDWTLSADSRELLQKIQESPFPAPNAFVFRKDGGGYSLLLSEDVYPNQPNVHDYTIAFPPSLFDSHCFQIKEVGPLVVVTLLCRTTQDMQKAGRGFNKSEIP